MKRELREAGRAIGLSKKAIKKRVKRRRRELREQAQQPKMVTVHAPIRYGPFVPVPPEAHDGMMALVERDRARWGDG